MPRLIVNADDFGRAPGVSRGIVEAHQRGIVTSTTMMVNLPWSEDAAGLARSTASLGVGLHLTFSYGPPVAPDVASLLGDDRRLLRNLHALQTSARADDIDREARAQFQRFIGLMGRLPTHLDSHQHVHTWPQSVEVIARLASEHQIPVRAVNVDHRDLLRSHGVPTTLAFINEFYVPGSMTLEGLLRVLRSVPNRNLTELMCHPGYDDPVLGDSSFRAQREDEMRFLCSEDVREALLQTDIELVDYQMVHGRDGAVDDDFRC